MGARISAASMPRCSCCGAKVAVDAQASCRRRAGVVALVVMVLLLLICRHLWRHCNGVVALVAMVSLPSLMCRCLAVVGDNGNGAMGGDDDISVDDDSATGYDNNNNQDGAMDDKVDDNDGNGAMDDVINNDCYGATGDKEDNNATDDDIDNNGNGTEDCDVDDDDGDRTTDGDRKTDDDVNNDGYGTTDDNIDDNCDGATDGRHRLDACGFCMTKGFARWRHATTGNTTTSRGTRCKWEERRQRTRGDRAALAKVVH